MDDMEWTPPSEAEMKVIQARRERADKISSLMGSYLLKGYKMLNETCSKCTTIYLRDKQDELYCVACMEVDADNEKDNPASSAEAARSQVAEAQFASPEPPPAAARAGGEPAVTPAAAASSAAPAVSSSTARTSASVPVPRADAASAPLRAEDEELAAAAAAVRAKLTWAAGQLEACASVEASLQLVALIGGCADALKALRRQTGTVDDRVVR